VKRTPLRRTRRTGRKCPMEWWVFIAGQRCANCPKPATDPHHVLTRNRLEREGMTVAVDDLDNCLPLCADCHAGHHRPGVTDSRLRRDRLRAENVGFAERVGLMWLLDEQYPSP
jgi:hypothetical protein